MAESLSSRSEYFFSADYLIRAMGHLEANEAVRFQDYLAEDFLNSERFEKNSPGSLRPSAHELF